MENTNGDVQLIKVANFVDRISAELAQSLLNEEGINAYVIADDAGGWRPNLLTGGIGAWVAVSSADADQALLVLQETNGPVDQAALEAEALSYAPPADA